MTNTIRNLLTVKQFSQKYPAFPEGGMRFRIFNADQNGFDQCLVRVGSKVLIDEVAFFKWVDEQNTKGDE
tara:strand:- start:804 stop:1013 length:210 start_codon:yes stop_codon:yes gene_type:complete